METAGIIVSLLGLPIGIIGTWFGVKSYYAAKKEKADRIKIEKVIKAITRSIPGDVALLNQHCGWANTNVRDAAVALNQLPDGDAKQNAIRHLILASGNTMTGRELSRSIFNGLLAFQYGQFGTRHVVYTGQQDLPLINLEAVGPEVNLGD